MTRLQRGDIVLLRASVAPARNHAWPSPTDPAGCRQWLAQVWADPDFAGAVRAATSHLHRAVEQAVRDPSVPARRVRKATTATAQYLLRAGGRPTPFGLFAGVATAYCGPALSRLGKGHRPVARPDTLWLDHVRRDLQGREDVLPHLLLRTCNLTVRRGSFLERAVPGGGTAHIRLGAPLAAALEMAVDHPVPYPQVVKQLVALGGTQQQAGRLLAAALDTGLLTTQLGAPMTEPDPLSHLLHALEPVLEHLQPGTAAVVAELRDAHRLLSDHNSAWDPIRAREIREAVESRMTAINPAGRSRLSVDLRLDATVQIPSTVLDEAEAAANALLRLTRHQGETPMWAAYHARFWDRYGAGSLVPVRDVIDPACGVGLPAGYPTSLAAEPSSRTLRRDELLMRAAQRATVGGTQEICLTDADLDQLTAPAREETVAPHVEMGIRVAAKSTKALDSGDFTLRVRPAWTGGNLTARFAALLPQSGLRESYSRLSTLVDGALPAQLSAAPFYPHAQAIARVPQVLTHIIPLGEQHPPSKRGGVIPLDDLAVLSTGRRLLLVSISRRRVVEPVVLHALALDKQLPPLVRFLAHLGRGFATAWTRFDWGPLASGLPFLPAVRYRKTLLTPARWHLHTDDLPAGPCDTLWNEALLAWARTWKCPPNIELADGDRTLHLDLQVPLHARLLYDHLRRHTSAELYAAPAEEDLGWIGHAHEVVMPLHSTHPPLPHPDLASAPVLTNSQLHDPSWLQVKVFTTPSAMDQILSLPLPRPLPASSWFVRYRSPQEEHHLRLRFAVTEHTRATTMQTLTAWVDTLRRDALASHLVLDGYRAEVGRYGSGEAMAAAEEVFVADSTTVRYALVDLPSTDRRVLCALGMISIAVGFLGEEAGTRWLATTTAPGHGLHEVTRPVAQQHHDGPEWTPRMTAALAARVTALARYRAHVAEPHLTTVLESLLHMHHNRVLGPDRDSEGACRHAARHACRSAWVRGNTP